MKFWNGTFSSVPFFTIKGSGKMEEDLCKYSEDKTSGLTAALWCTIINDYCGRCRYCKTKQKIVMTSEYIKNGCNVKNKYENNQKGGI